MKKFLTLAILAAVAGAAHAASIDWAMNLGRSGKIVDVDGTAINGTVYLLLADDAASLADAAEADTFASSLESLALGSATLTGGKNSAPQTATSDKLTASSADGPQYTFAVVVYDAANNQYYTSGTMANYAYQAPDDDATSVTFGASSFASPNWTSSVPSSTPAVPEPATGALALAGVALLFKRRRA